MKAPGYANAAFARPSCGRADCRALVEVIRPGAERVMYADELLTVGR
ncbi:hypothetical protein ACFVYV_01500 [Streptomyces mirabilis]|nr:MULTISPECIES: hypothetical protein [Streptomyces]